MQCSTIYAADDDTLVTDILAQYLEGAGYRFMPLPTVEATLRQIRKVPPALLILDLYMPDGNGLDVLRWLKDDGLLGRVQVLMLSGEDDPAVAELARALGAGGYLLKPFGARRLLAETRRLIGPAVVEVAPAVEAVEEADLNPVLAGLKSTHGAETVNKLLMSLSRALLNLERELPPSQAELERTAHALKDAAGTLGFTLVSSTCSALERACQEGHTLDLPLREAVSACVLARHDIARHLHGA
jgi:DNA-binding response OmpR family regulator